MKRPVGVTVSGVTAIIGSLLLVLMSIMIASLRSLPSPPTLPDGTPAPPVNVAGILVVEAVVLMGFAIAGIVSAIALLRRRNWGRISFLIFAGLLGGLSTAAMIGELVAIFVGPLVLPPQQNVPPQGVLTVVFGVAAIFFLGLVGLSVWWLIYFTRRSVKAHFLSEAEIATPRRGPLSVTIIAWLLVVSGVFVSLSFLTSYPVVMFGIVFRGWSAHVMLLLFGAVSFVAGLGMLRWRAAAHSLALAFYGLSLLSIGTSLVLPGSFAQMQSVMRETIAQTTIPATSFPGDRFFVFSLLLGLADVCVPLWFLITRRKAFLDACREPSDGTPRV